MKFLVDLIIATCITIGVYFVVAILTTNSVSFGFIYAVLGFITFWAAWLFQAMLVGVWNITNVIFDRVRPLDAE
jgi:hypothetical protein